MKSKRLIELLQEEDPSGETEVCLYSEDGNVDILYLETKPGYWDGVYQVLERDWSDRYYNVTGAQYRSDGYKIMITPHSIQEALYRNPELPVTVIDDFVEKKMQKQVDKWRDSIKKEKEQIDKELLQEYTYSVLNMIKDGWKVIQPSDAPVGKYNVMWFVRDPSKFKLDELYTKNSDNQKKLRQGDCMAVLKSCFFKHETIGNLTYWTLIF